MRRLRGPATNCTGTSRSPGSGNRFVCWATLKHRGQIASQFDPELTALRSHDDRINEPTQCLRRLDAAVFALQRRGELFDLGSVEVGHARVQQWQRFVCDPELSVEFVPALGVREQLLLRFARGQLVVQNQIDLLLPSRLDPREARVSLITSMPL